MPVMDDYHVGAERQASPNTLDLAPAADTDTSRIGAGDRLMSKVRVPGRLALALWLATGSAVAQQSLVSLRVDSEIQVDGVADEGFWSRVAPVVTRDPLARIDIELRAAHTADWLYMVARFPDREANYAHKTMIWNADEGRYVQGPDREDTFVVKWSMEPLPVDLSIDADEPYRADIWFWKAHRTDHAGFADDKMHIYSRTEVPGAYALISRQGQRFYVSRNGDAGKAAYVNRVYGVYQGERQPPYRYQMPTGSRADVRAKGHWQDGFWTVEFARKRVTGHPDDVQFRWPGRYLFGVSRYEIAGRPPNPELEEPLYGSGDVSEELELVIE